MNSETSHQGVFGRRIVAGIIDVLVLGVVFGLLGLISGGAGTVHSADGTSSVQVQLSGGWFLIYIAIVLAYYIGSEATSGRTFGKLLLGIRVYAGDGTRVSTRAVVVRTLARIIDGLPILYLVGFVSMLATGTPRKRLGDLMADTIVQRA